MKLETCGTIRTSGALPDRLSALFEAVTALIAKQKPDAVAVERVLFNSNVRTAMSTGQAAGVMLLAASRSGIEIAEYTPTQMKAAVTGYGASDKKQVQFMIAKLLNLKDPPRPADAADAVGLAITHIAAHRSPHSAKSLSRA